MLAILAMLKRLVLALAILLVLAGVLYFAAARILGSDLVRSTLEQQLSASLGQPVRIGAASAAIYPRVAVDLHSVAIGEPVSVTVNRMRVVTGLRPLLSRRVEDAEVILSDGELRLPVAFDLIPASDGSAALTRSGLGADDRVDPDDRGPPVDPRRGNAEMAHGCRQPDRWRSAGRQPTVGAVRGDAVSRIRRADQHRAQLRESSPLPRIRWISMS